MNFLQDYVDEKYNVKPLFAIKKDQVLPETYEQAKTYIKESIIRIDKRAITMENVFWNIFCKYLNKN